MMMPFKRARFPMGTAAATHVMAPVRMPEPPIPVTALAAISIGEDVVRPAIKDPSMKIAINAMSVGLSGSSRKSFPARGDMAQLSFEISVSSSPANFHVMESMPATLTW